MELGLNSMEVEIIKFLNWIEFCFFVSLIQNLNSLCKKLFFFLYFCNFAKNQDMFASC